MRSSLDGFPLRSVLVSALLLTFGCAGQQTSHTNDRSPSAQASGDVDDRARKSEASKEDEKKKIEAARAALEVASTSLREAITGLGEKETAETFELAHAAKASLESA